MLTFSLDCESSLEKSHLWFHLLFLCPLLYLTECSGLGHSRVTSLHSPLCRFPPPSLLSGAVASILKLYKHSTTQPVWDLMFLVSLHRPWFCSLHILFLGQLCSALAGGLTQQSLLCVAHPTDTLAFLGSLLVLRTMVLSPAHSSHLVWATSCLSFHLFPSHMSL